TIKHLLEQIRDKAIPIFKMKFPNAITVFAFDNSTSYARYAKNALLAERMNLGPGKKQLVMQPTTFINANRVQRIQKLVFKENYPNPAM
ncbi:20039_t:CDS:1, partial [Cetraspora pellucida]